MVQDILNYNWFLVKALIAKNINGLFYFLRKLPLLGKHIPVSIYQAYGFKSALFYIGLLIGFAFKLLWKFLWLTLYYILSFLFFNFIKGENVDLLAFDPAVVQVAFYLWLINVCFFSRGVNAYFSQVKKDNFELVSAFHLSHRTYLLSQIFAEPLMTGLAYLPALFVYARLAKQPILVFNGFFAVGAYCLTAVALRQMRFRKDQLKLTQSLKKRNLPMVIVGGLYSILLFVLFMTQVQFFTLERTHWLFLMLHLILIVGSLTNLLRFQASSEYISFEIEEALNVRAMTEDIVAAQNKNQYVNEGLAMQKKLKLDGEASSNLTGMAYLNDLLFQRYHKILQRKLYWRLTWVLVAAVAGLIIAYLEKDFMKEKDMTFIFPNLFFIMYLGSMSKSIVQMVFINCDLTMLNFPFYRESQTILAGFRFRLKQSLKYTGIYGLAVFLAIQVWIGFQGSFHFNALLVLMILALIGLLSFHDWFIYYLLQPFTRDMEVVNPLYKILSGATYFVAYMHLQIDVLSPSYVLGLSLILLAYVGIGYAIILRQAPKTFRLK